MTRRKPKIRQVKQPFKPRWAEYFQNYHSCLKADFIGSSITVEQLASLMAGFKNRPPSDGSVAPRIVIGGQSSSGKSTLADLAAKILDLPTIRLNASLLSPPSYKGQCVNTALFQLATQLEESKNSPHHPKAVVIIDECDKLAARKRVDEFTSQIELSLLPIFGGELVTANDPDNMCAGSVIDTKHCLVIALGVFNGVPPAAWKSPEVIRLKLHHFGFSTEFVSRLSVFKYLAPLRSSDIESFVTAEALKLSLQFQTFEHAPKLSTREIKEVAKSCQRSPFGLRSSRSRIFELLMNKAKTLTGYPII